MYVFNFLFPSWSGLASSTWSLYCINDLTYLPILISFPCYCARWGEDPSNHLMSRYFLIPRNWSFFCLSWCWWHAGGHLIWVLGMAMGKPKVGMKSIFPLFSTSKVWQRFFITNDQTVDPHRKRDWEREICVNASTKEHSTEKREETRDFYMKILNWEKSRGEENPL